MINSEPTINIESEIDNKKSDEQMRQIVESIEAESYVDDFKIEEDKVIEAHDRS